MSTINADTGLLLTGVGEVWQSISCIFNTPSGSRIMRRFFGAQRPSFQDKGISPMNLVDFYAAINDALVAEPRFRVAYISLNSTTSDIVNGHAIFTLEGVYYPRAQLGDYSQAVTAKGTFTWSDSNGASIVQQ